MTLKKQYIKIIWEILAFFGTLMFISVLYMSFNNKQIIGQETIWQFVLLSATLVLRGESLINFHNLSEHKMRWNYMISSVLADVTLLILLYYFTPGGQYFHGKGGIILAVYIITKGLIYVLLYVHSRQSANEINKQLNQLKNQSK